MRAAIRFIRTILAARSYHRMTNCTICARKLSLWMQNRLLTLTRNSISLKIRSSQKSTRKTSWTSFVIKIPANKYLAVTRFMNQMPKIWIPTRERFRSKDILSRRTIRQSRMMMSFYSTIVRSGQWYKIFAPASVLLTLRLGLVR